MSQRQSVRCDLFEFNASTIHPFKEFEFELDEEFHIEPRNPLALDAKSAARPNRPSLSGLATRLLSTLRIEAGDKGGLVVAVASEGEVTG